MGYKMILSHDNECQMTNLRMDKKVVLKTKFLKNE